MRIYMQLPAGDQAAPRFYHLHLQEDLLEGWTLVREWGHQGAGGRVRRDHFDSREAAEQAMMRARDDQLRRGYRVVFIQGQEQP
ncbi:WGR domain-containing protein [Thiohalobacter sp. IOR34]|uniref:WGR domain-containing protein n=1 Tax=Thiohalobacter sp. IOR34 TaxID=3057176 RepID=UPI0025B21A77|nr:WGR domain-containing protein [Thiohalobacter sp. IOR34]WJW75681.1 WGR domain-containing protein [Thiohalobacter sp. IOR34]